MKKTLLKALIILSILCLVYFIGDKLGSYLFPLHEISKVLIIDGDIKPGNSIYSTLTSKFSVKESVLVGNALARVFDTNRVKPEDKYKIYYSTSNRILKFVYVPSPFVSYVLDRSSIGFVVSEIIPDVDEKFVASKGKISSSLYEGMSASGLNPRIIMNFADIFQWQVDFFTDVQPGDKFLLVFKRSYIDNRPVLDGAIVYAAYKGVAGNFSAIRFQDGKFPDYYDSEGKSLRKQFLKAPLNFRRISSHFSYRRKHPILKYVRPHLGIDYVAPRGAPVSAIGSGKVTFAGWKGSNGRLISIRHNSIYTTHYGHLKAYAKGIRKGVFVKQDQVIGYVGSSGLSTGPHLHFTIKKYGKPVNFLRIKLPAAKSVSKKNLEEFGKKVDRARMFLAYLESDFFYKKVAPLEDYENSEEYNDIYITKLQK